MGEEELVQKLNLISISNYSTFDSILEGFKIKEFYKTYKNKI